MNQTLQDLTRNWKALGAPVPELANSDVRAREFARSLLDRTAASKFRVDSDFKKEALYALVRIIREELAHHDPKGPGDRVAGIRILSEVDWPEDPVDELADLRVGISLDPETAVDFSRLTPEGCLELIGVLREEIGARPALFLPRCEEVLADPSKQGDDFQGRIAAELRMLMAAGCRLLQDLVKADAHLDSAEAYLETFGSEIDLAQLAFQRIAVSATRRETLDVREDLSRLAAIFRAAGFVELALKADLLRGAALNESGRFLEACRVLGLLVEEAAEVGSAKMLAYGLVGLANSHAALGDVDSTERLSARAEEALQRFPNPIALAKLHWHRGDLLRERERYEQAAFVYRRSIAEFSQLRLDAEMAGLRLVLADVLLTTGRKAEAIEEIAQAIPVIVTHSLSGESAAALTLLRRSLKSDSVDRSALRQLQTRLTPKLFR